VRFLTLLYLFHCDFSQMDVLANVSVVHTTWETGIVTVGSALVQLPPQSAKPASKLRPSSCLLLSKDWKNDELQKSNLKMMKVTWQPNDVKIEAAGQIVERRDGKNE
jgi:hypothetical protein